ncbi:MAG: 2'-5' RNA ligase family protein [Pseudomonadota bacterium]
MIYVVAYPRFEKNLSAALTHFRNHHEPERARLIAPHVTLVFGSRLLNSVSATTLCERVAEKTSKFSLAFSEAEIIHDPFEDTHKICLMVSEGNEELKALHRDLYLGDHSSELQSDLPYRPHMTIAANPDRSALEDIDVSQIGAFPIRAIIDALDVVEVKGGDLTAVRSIPLI